MANGGELVVITVIISGIDLFNSHNSFSVIFMSYM